MQTKQIYMAIDGVRFDTETECLEYEHKLTELDEIKKLLPEQPDETSDFWNGKGYIRHGNQRFIYRKKLLIIARDVLHINEAKQA